MSEHQLDDELSMMYQEDNTPKVLDASAFAKPIKHIKSHKPISMSPEHTVEKAIHQMNERRVGCVLVTENKKLVGIFTERDVLKRVAGKPETLKKTLREMMTPKVEGLQAEDSIAFVLNSMHVGGYRHVPIMDEHGLPSAVISVKDIVGYIIEHFTDEIVNLPPSPMRTTTEREGA